MKLNNWTIIKYSGRAWHDEKWKCARDVLEAAHNDMQSGGGNYDNPKILLHNAEIIVSENFSNLIWEYGRFARDQWEQRSKAINDMIEKLIPTKQDGG